MMIKIYRTQGFTLIELSIVLVIIGLVVGGILTGKDLVRAAQTRLQIAQIEKLNTAVNTFKTKYQCLPGDCDKASDLGLNPYGYNGDGNGFVEQSGTFDTGVMTTAEPTYFWYELKQSGMIEANFVTAFPGDSYPGINSPPLKLPGMGTEESENPAGGVWIATKRDIAPNISPSMNHAWFLSASISYIFSSLGVYLPMDAYNIDNKIDDGYPQTGFMRAITYWGPPGISPGSGAIANGLVYTAVIADGKEDACVDDTTTPATYHISVTAPSQFSLCAPLIKAAF